MKVKWDRQSLIDIAIKAAIKLGKRPGDLTNKEIMHFFNPDLGTKGYQERDKLDKAIVGRFGRKSAGGYFPALKREAQSMYDALSGTLTAMLPAFTLTSPPSLPVAPVQAGLLQYSCFEKGKKYLISSVEHDAEVDPAFLKSLELMAQERNYTILLLTSQMKMNQSPLLDIYRANGHYVSLINLDEDERVVFEDYCRPPTAQEPLSGLVKLMDDKIVWGISHNKQSMRTAPNLISHNLQRKSLWSTGSICTPKVFGFKPNQRKATELFKQGALVVEVTNRHYHVRNVRAARDGSFIDIDLKFDGTKDRSSAVRASAFIYPDKHVGFHDPKTVKAWDEIIQASVPRHVVLHDYFDGHSINPYTGFKAYGTQFAHIPACLKTLAKELEACVNEFQRDLTIFPADAKIIFPLSNHHLFLDRFIDNGDYVRLTDPASHELAHLLAIRKFKGYNLLQSVIDPSRRALWLGANDSYLINGVECGQHGHNGTNGAKGMSLKSGRKEVFGHTHSPGFEDDSFCVGTSTAWDMPYTKGSTTWGNAGGLVHEDDNVQIICSYEGEWNGR